MEETKEGLHLEEDIGFQKREWKFERFGWFIMLLVFLASLAGLLGRKGLIWDQTTAGNKNTGLEAKYYQFLHRETPAEFQVVMKSADSRLELQSQSFEKLKIENILPKPSKMEYHQDKILLWFEPDVQGPDREVKIFFNPMESGTLNVSLKTGSGNEIKTSQFIYP